MFGSESRYICSCVVPGSAGSLPQIPQSYLSANWPIRYSALSADGRLIALAGRRGLAHYSSTSGRWKLFTDERQEQAFTVRGGLLWFHHVLVAAVEVARTFQVSLRLFMSRQAADDLFRFVYTRETWTSATKMFYTGKYCLHPSSSFHSSTTLCSYILQKTSSTTTSSCLRRRASSFTCAEA